MSLFPQKKKKSFIVLNAFALAMSYKRLVCCFNFSICVISKIKLKNIFTFLILILSDDIGLNPEPVYNHHMTS